LNWKVNTQEIFRQGCEYLAKNGEVDRKKWKRLTNWRIFEEEQMGIVSIKASMEKCDNWATSVVNRIKDKIPNNGINVC